MVTHDKLRCLVKIPGSAIVAQAFPIFQHFLFMCLGQISDCGEPCEKLLEEGDDRRHLSLLQHHLADPNGIGITTGTPGQVALIGPVP
ncbi:MAG: hypothetical protein QM703_15625 [Gemmatales bacterium]